MHDMNMTVDWLPDVVRYSDQIKCECKKLTILQLRLITSLKKIDALVNCH